MYYATNFIATTAGRSFAGIISRQSHSLNPANRVEIIEADVMNAEIKLQVGMFAKAEISFHTC